MTRLLGAALLAAGCVGAGVSAAGRLEGRVRDLRQLIAGLEELERELGWRQAPLPELLERAGQGSGGRAAVFFRRCAQRASRLEGCPFRMAWAQELEGASLRLTTPDRLLLDQLGSVLGRYDAASQVQALAEGAARLEEQRRAAQDSRQRLGRVYTALGLAGGALMMILLI